MAETTSLIKSRHLAYAGIGLIAVKIALVAVFGFKPPEFKAGYHVPAEPEVETTLPALTDYQRLRELEAILSPAPVLAWATPTSNYAIPNIIAPDVVLGFGMADKAEENKTEPEQQLSETASPDAQADKDVTQLAMATPAPRTAVTPPSTLDLLGIEPVYIETLPDLSGLEVKQRKKQFIAFMLPLILRANIELEDRRKRIDATFGAGRIDRLKQWAEFYNFDAKNMTAEDIYNELIIRVKPVPVSIALAQAAVESGWGTSRFATQGNAIYGQWAWSADAGIRPKDARYENAVIRSFANLFDSVRAYMHNLNTHRAYAEFRTTRHDVANKSLENQLPAILKTLDQYSEKGDEYIATLIDVMNDNKLWVYDGAQLATE